MSNNSNNSDTVNTATDVFADANRRIIRMLELTQGFRNEPGSFERLMEALESSDHPEVLARRKAQSETSL